MPTTIRSVSAGLAVAATSAALLLMEAPIPTEPAAAEILESGSGRQWYRGNLHTHSLWSDGDDYLEMIALWYKEHDYDFLCFTDHNVLADKERWSNVEENKGGREAYDKLKSRFAGAWVNERTNDDQLEVRLKTFAEVRDQIAEPGKYLLIQGEEITDRFGNLPVHMNATNVREMIPPMHGESVYDTIQNITNALVAQRERTGQPMLIHLNHPNFGYGVTAEDLMRVRGENFFEVYNGHPSVNNTGDELHASTEKIWDIILTKRLAEIGLPPMYGLATDDGHNYHKIPSRGSEPGRGWVMVLAEELTPESLIAAMEAGEFYSSSGVELQRVVSSKQGLNVEVKPEAGVEYQIRFVGTRKGYDPASQPAVDGSGEVIRATRRYSDDVGETFSTIEGTTAEYRFQGDEYYVRAVITSSRLHPNPSEPGDFEQAWTQPTLGPAASLTN